MSCTQKIMSLGTSTGFKIPVLIWNFISLFYVEVSKISEFWVMSEGYMRSCKRTQLFSWLLVGTEEITFLSLPHLSLHPQAPKSFIFSIESRLSIWPSDRLRVLGRSVWGMEYAWHVIEIKSFPNKKKLKEFTITKPLLYEMLKGLI